MRRRDFLLGSLSLLAGSSLVFRASELDLDRQGEWIERVQPMMGSFVSIAIWHKGGLASDRIVDDCFRYIAATSSELSLWDSCSQLISLNSDSKISLRELSPANRDLLVRVASRKRSAFNPLCRALTELWQGYKRTEQLPDPQKVEAARVAVEASEIFVEREMLVIEGDSGIDLDGVAHGYLSDLAAQFLRRRGVQFGRISCGGDLRFFGDTIWHCSIQAATGIGELGNFERRGDFSVATSGDSQNRWKVGDQEFHHLINPQSGFPGRINRQVTVAAGSGIEAEIMAKELFFGQTEGWDRLIKRVPSSEYVVVDSLGAVHPSKGLNFRSA